jgi:hypothetical protein
MDTLPRESLEPEVLFPDEAPAPEPTASPGVVALDWTGPNYHIALWDTPVTYLCLPCHAQGMTLVDVETHVTTVHAMEPVPTPLAADASLLPSLMKEQSSHA